MSPIDLVITVCAVLSPTTCEEQHLHFADGGASLQQGQQTESIKLHIAVSNADNT